MRAAGRPVLLSSHILAEVEKLCDRVTIIRNGRTVESGTLAELRHLTRSTVTAVDDRRPRPGWARCPACTTSPSRAAASRFQVDNAELDAVAAGPDRASACAAWSAAPPTLEELFLRHYGDELAAIGRAAMTATAEAPVRAEAAQLFAGTGALLRFALRRDRLRLAIWVLAVGGITVYSAVGLARSTRPPPTAQARAAVISGPGGSPAQRARLRHRPLHARRDAGQRAGALSVMVAAAIMSIQLVVRHTRAEEESGRAELVRAGIVGRRAPLTAALALAALADAAVVVVIAAGLAGSGLRRSTRWRWPPGSGSPVWCSARSPRSRRS